MRLIINFEGYGGNLRNPVLFVPTPTRLLIWPTLPTPLSLDGLVLQNETMETEKPWKGSGIYYTFLVFPRFFFCHQPQWSYGVHCCMLLRNFRQPHRGQRFCAHRLSDWCVCVCVTKKKSARRLASTTSGVCVCVVDESTLHTTCRWAKVTRSLVEHHVMSRVWCDPVHCSTVQF